MGTPEDVAAEKYFTPPEDIREEIAEWLFKRDIGATGITYDISWGHTSTVIHLKYMTDATYLLAFIGKAGYVKLAVDQELPDVSPQSYGCAGDIRLAQSDMLSAGWRKVELPE